MAALAFALLFALNVYAAPAEQERRAFAEGVARKVLDAAVAESLASAEWARVVIAFAHDPGESPAKHRDAALARIGPLGFVAARRFQRLPVLVGAINAKALAALVGDPHVLRISLDAVATAQLAEAVPLVNLDDLHYAGLNGAGAQVAILDTGVDLDHADFAGAVVAEHCFCDTAPGPAGCCPNGQDEQSGAGAAQDDHGHGTRVAGVVTSAGVWAPPGGAPDAQLVAVKVLNSGGGGALSDILAGFDWVLAFQPDVSVVNASFALFDPDYGGDCDTADAITIALASSVNQLHAVGALTVAGAGNNQSGTVMGAPACIAKAVSVGAVWDANVGSQSWFGCTDAVTAENKVACWSNSNAKTDVFAPGGPMTSSLLNGASITSAGTSYATPLVAACAATLRAAHPSATPDQLTAALKTSSVIVVDAKNGLSFPRLNCAAGHQFLGGPQIPSLSGSAWLPLAAALAIAGAAAQRSVRRRRTDARALRVR